MAKFGALIFLTLLLTISLSCSQYTKGLEQSVARADEISAVMALRTVYTAQQTYSVSNSGSYATFPELVAGGYLEKRFDSETPRIKDYVLTMSVVPRSGDSEPFYSCNADPARAGDKVGRHLYMDSGSADIRVNATQPASATDPTFKP